MHRIKAVSKGQKSLSDSVRVGRHVVGVHTRTPQAHVSVEKTSMLQAFADGLCEKRRNVVDDVQVQTAISAGKRSSVALIIMAGFFPSRVKEVLVRA